MGRRDRRHHGAGPPRRGLRLRRRRADETGELAVCNTIALLRGRKTQKVGSTSIRPVTKGNADTALLHCPADY
ncbi:hypothetical protein ACN6LL_007803 [Streptomyces violaceoruber]